MKALQKNRTKQKDGKIFAKKSFGQNFLIDEKCISKIIGALNPQKDETIIEIGAGRGALTEKLISSSANVIAIEIERDMITFLKQAFGDAENFKLIESDALKVNFGELAGIGKKAKLAANLPYYISTAILQKLMDERKVFSEIILMFQREVVERITAEVGNSERGFLTVLTENSFEVEKLFDVPPRAFRPAPQVWSAVVKLIPKKENPVADEKLFREIISAAFVQKRKTILNNFKNAKSKVLGEINWQNVLQKSEIEENRRAESLSIDEWKRLAEVVDLN